MPLYELIIISLALSVEPLAITYACGFRKGRNLIFKILKTVVFLSVFQGVFIVLGIYTSSLLKNMLEGAGDYICMIMLFIVGIKMIFFSGAKKYLNKNFSLDKTFVLVILSAATSINAFILGLGFYFIQINISMAFITVFLSTFFMSFLGFFVNKKLPAAIFEKRVKKFGGIVMIIFALKIIVENFIL